jgi:GNAT superfamily N-acetyltransferase
LYGGDNFSGRENSLLDPMREPAKIRAFFVHPDWIRRGIATLILEACESAASRAGFASLEMGATLTGVPFYAAHGYSERERNDASLGNGLALPILRMEKNLGIDTLPGGRST